MAFLLTMDQRRQAAFTFAQDATKQLIALSTGVIALTITFFHDFASTAGPAARALMAISWVLYLLSILCGLATLLALTGSLEPRGADASAPSIRGSNVTYPAVAQVILFVLAVALTVLAGILALAIGR
jgi:hypothetical protein